MQKSLLSFEFQVWASLAAFLAFLTLELQTKRKTSLIPPNDPNDTKKIYKIGISYILAFHLAFATFIGLFQFFWGPWSLRSPVARISDISDPFIIRKNYCLKFLIFDNCDGRTDRRRSWNSIIDVHEKKMPF